MTAIIIVLILILVPVVITAMTTWNDGYGDGVATVMNSLAVAFVMTLVAFVIFYPLARVTGGALPNYSEGVREGFITKVSVKGAIWKTNEAQIQVGTGAMAALQEPFSFSISDPDMAELVRSYLGEQVRIEYIQWFVQPVWLGETTYDCVSIVPIND